MKLSLFRSVTEAWRDDELECTWPEAQDFLTWHWLAARKTDVGMFNLGDFRSATDPQVEWARRYDYIDGQRQDTYQEMPGRVRRCIHNLIGINGIVLDFDGGLGFDEAIDQYRELSLVAYTTFRNLVPDDRGHAVEKFRVVIPFARPLLRDDIAGRRASIQALFPAVDQASFSQSQAFYLHSGPHPRTHTQAGLILDPYEAFEEYIAPAQPTAPPPELSDWQQQRIIDLLRESFVGEWSTWTRIGWGLKAGGFSVADFQYVTAGMMNNKTAEDARRVWQDGGRQSGPRVTMGTVIHFLKKRYGEDCLRDTRTREQRKIQEIEQRLKEKYGGTQ